MRTFVFGVLLAATCFVHAQERTYRDTLVLLDYEAWRVQLLSEVQFMPDMNSRDAAWKPASLYKGEVDTIETSYRACCDAIQTCGLKQYGILGLTGSASANFCSPGELVADTRAGMLISITGSSAKMREDENRLDSIWRAENIWNLGVLDRSGRLFKDLSTIEPPRWAKWDYDLQEYFTSQMVYPEHLLKKNQAGYSVVMFSIDTLGLPRGINILTSKHKEFDKEVIRLTKALPHCLPCRDKDGKRMECFYTAYVPFLPQHYRDRLKADSLAREGEKHMFVEWEAVSYFQEGKPWSAQAYITQRLVYDPALLEDKQQVRGIYTVRINSYGEVYDVKVTQSCGIQDWDNQVLEIIRKMPRWMPAINYYGKGEYRESMWTIPIVFKKNGSLIAYTTENDKHLEVGVPVCYLNERGDTIVPYGKYRFCQTDTIRHIGFVYENKQDARIVCIDNQGKELFYVFKCDNGPDYIHEGFFRIMDENGLIGFSDSLGNVVIKPQFKFAFPFDDGHIYRRRKSDI